MNESRDVCNRIVNDLAKQTGKPAVNYKFNRETRFSKERHPFVEPYQHKEIEIDYEVFAKMLRQGQSLSAISEELNISISTLRGRIQFHRETRQAYFYGKNLTPDSMESKIREIYGYYEIRILPRDIDVLLAIAEYNNNPENTRKAGYTELKEHFAENNQTITLITLDQIVTSVERLIIVEEIEKAKPCIETSGISRDRFQCLTPSVLLRPAKQSKKTKQENL
jgi:hypothetical protein